MTKASIHLAESALDDLRGVMEWYVEQNAPDVGHRLVRDTLKQIEVLADHPDAGRVVPEFDQPFLRELIRPPFRIVYRKDRESVHIVRVWRSERLLHLP
ncbi:MULTISPECIES: type II toxin-antitoxin system RelE/ParE family toxin [unclassified Ectothiorhodospira]|uniref:type II toxin-antitoxin system RelE/ParE family toxin n=1 Tax=unclassified Ectothiorhodospira TaxID=2684909 RepID=UPI001EE94CA4|nr:MULTISPECIES: type II toxin-antitoxin system RelE/ParE family toxin [unclassified Ectothiorhodospira]MCG5517081.1 type II toxin-antitoxin system RelE/ParE family toxin [Ectothiorhodospira sp. 9100]MCG5520328.1 type II toxin-antitoxin system RelE/ParE family toxin [Ectothiorhodospira sp. 9905]